MDRAEPLPSERRGAHRGQMLIGGAALAALLAVALVSLTGVFATGAWLPRSIAIAASTVLAAAVLRAAFPLLSAPASLGGPLIGLAVWLGTLIASGRLPVWLEDPHTCLQQIEVELVIGAAPIPPSPELADLLATGVLLLAALVAVLHAGLQATLAPGVIAALLLLAPPVVTTRSIEAPFLILSGLLLAVLLWSGSPELRWGGLATAALAVAVAAGAVSIAPVTRDRVWNSANLSAPVGSSTPDVTLALADDLRARSSTPAFTYVTDDDAPIRFTLATLADFSGGRWQPQDDLAADDLDVAVPRDPALVPPVAAEDAARDRATAEIRIEGLVSEWLPLPQSAVRVGDAREGPAFDTEPWHWIEDAATARSDASATHRGDSYAVSYALLTAAPASPRPEGGRNAANALPIAPAEAQPRYEDPDSAPANLQPYLELPGTVPESIRAEAQRLRAGAGSDDLLAVSAEIERWFRGGSFVYDESTPYEPGTDADDPYAIMESFLSERRGFCVHYASAFGVIARELGIPTRVAVGYASRPNGADATTVRGRDLHAWPEVYVAGAGWVAFEPTPGGAGYRADNDEDVPATPGDDEDEAADETSADRDTGTPAPEPTAEQPGTDDPRADSATDSPADSGSPWTPWWVGLSAVALLVLVPAGARGWIASARRRRMRIGSPAASPAEAAWSEFCATAIDLGLLRDASRHPQRAPVRATPGPHRPRARTPEAIVEYLIATGALGSGAAQRAAWTLASAVTAERYAAGAGSRSAPGASNPGELLESCGIATTALRKSVPRRHRVKAALVPVSLLPHG